MNFNPLPTFRNRFFVFDSERFSRYAQVALDASRRRGSRPLSVALLCVSPSTPQRQTHLMTTLVKLSPRRLSRHRRPERNEEHTPLGAKLLIPPPGVPPLAKAFGRKNDPPPASPSAWPQAFSQGLMNVETPAPPGPRREARATASLHSSPPSTHLREQRNGSKTGSSRSAALP